MSHQTTSTTEFAPHRVIESVELEAALDHTELAGLPSEDRTIPLDDGLYDNLPFTD
jgi:hypothetical protein